MSVFTECVVLTTTKCIRYGIWCVPEWNWTPKALNIDRCRYLSGLFDIWLSHLSALWLKTLIRRYVLSMRAIRMEFRLRFPAHKWSEWQFHLYSFQMLIKCIAIESDIYRMCLWRINTRAWWMDLANPSLNTCVWRRRSKKSSIFKPNT